MSEMSGQEAGKADFFVRGWRDRRVGVSGIGRGRLLRQLRGSPWIWFLLDELGALMESEELLQRAIGTIGQSDPIVKLLQQVKMGKMKAGDAGLRAVVEAWLGTYEKVIKTEGLTQAALRRIDPAPRVAVLLEAGVLQVDQPSVRGIEQAFSQALAQAPAN